jgi:diguanylate cyclase (GGDEF)-like protein
MGIQKRLLLFPLFVLIPLLLVQGFTYYEWFQERKAAEMRANLELARTVAKTFDAFVKEVLRTELAIGMAATASPALLHKDLRNILSKATKANPALRNFSWVSPEGRVLASGNPKFENVDISKTDYYAKIRSGREWVLGDLIASKVTRKPVFTISRGIRDSRGNLLGIVGTFVLPDGLNKVLLVERSKDAGVSLIDSKGIHVYRYPAMGYTSEQSNWLKHYVLKGKEIATTVVSKVTGKKQLVGFAPVSSMGWVAAASRAEDDVREAVASTLLSKAILFLLVALAAFGAALALFRPIPISIARLRDHVLAIGRGEMEKLAVVSGPSELKDLAFSINQMGERVLKEFEKLALLDNLTQLPNRNYIEREIQSRFEEKKRFNVPFGILFIDIDHFKNFNDIYGHDVGDDVLKFVAKTFVANARPFDLYGRWGGEEFIGVIRNINGKDLELLGDRLRSLINNSYILHDNEKLYVTISIGATLIRENDTIKSLIKRSDALLYKSKAAGRNRLTIG